MLRKILTTRINFILTTILVLLSLSTLLMTGALFWLENKTEEISSVSEHVSKAVHQFNTAIEHEKNFLLYEVIDTVFYKSQQSKIANSFHVSLGYFRQNLSQFDRLIAQESELKDLQANILKIDQEASRLDSLFQDLVSLVLRRGFKNWGSIGKMRRHIHQIEHSGLPTDKALMLMIRRHEKDYLLRKQPQYPLKLQKAVTLFKNSLDSFPASPGKTALIQHLADYQSAFLNTVALEKKIGYEEDEGLTHILFDLEHSIGGELATIEKNIQAYIRDMRRQLLLKISLLSVVAILITLFAAWFVNRRISRPIVALSETIRKSIESDFKEKLEFGKKTGLAYEIRRIGKDVGRMYHKIQSMLSEMIMQKEELAAQTEMLQHTNIQMEENIDYINAKNFELTHKNEEILLQKAQLETNYDHIKTLTKIGQDITLNLNTEDIINIVYEGLHKSLNIEVFGIGVYKAETQVLDFYTRERDSVYIYRRQDSLEDKNQFSVYCFENNEEIIINDIDQEYKNYLSEPPKSLTKEKCYSQVYLPLSVKQGLLGVIALRSTEKYAYDEFNLSIFRNLAAYITIAVENANSYHKITLHQSELSVANREITRKNKMMTDSINYATRIQATIFPKREKISEVFSDFFILLKPRDMVSGDFYFFSKVPRILRKITDVVPVIIAADCTGHGVPGAFTSMVGNSWFNTVVNLRGTYNPSRILRQVNIGIHETFKQRETDNKDGMDAGIVAVDFRKKQLLFSGARSNLVYIQNGELHEIRGDTRSVGGENRFDEENVPYTLHKIDMENTTHFYLFSDGYRDQFGGKLRQKIGSKNFKALLFEHHQKPMDTQKRILDEYLKDYMKQGKEAQIDDVMILGFKMPSIQ